MKRKLRGIVGGTALFLLATYLFVRFVVGDVYHVGTSSMEPTIWGVEGGGEWVFVRFDRSAPDRGALVVANVAGESTPVVKRVAGLPGERVRVSDGDLLVDHVRLRPSEHRPALVPIFDDRWHRLDERFRLDGESARRWTRDGDAWRLDARDVAPDASTGLLTTNRPLVDDYLGPDHELVAGSAPVHDVRFECEVRFDEPRGRVRVVLREDADEFELVLARSEDGAATLTLTRVRPADAAAPMPSDASPASTRETLAEMTCTLALGTWTTLAFENRDDTLRAECGALAGPIAHTYKENSVAPGADAAVEAARSDRVAFGGDSGVASFRRIRLARDLDYTDEGRFGVADDVQLGPAELFLLGDHSSHSQDSREWGPVPLSALRGRPVAVVWPPARWRRLGP